MIGIIRKHTFNLAILQSLTVSWLKGIKDIFLWKRDILQIIYSFCHVVPRDFLQMAYFDIH
jgi:hypothetical protein